MQGNVKKMFHKLSGIPVEVCTAEAKIAYDMAYSYAYSARNMYRQLYSDMTEEEKCIFIQKAINDCMNMWGVSYYNRNSRYSEKGVRESLEAGIERYFLNPKTKLINLNEIGDMFRPNKEISEVD